MRRPYQMLVPLLSLFLCRVDLTDLFPMEISARVLEVLDGDTLVIKYGHTIERLRLSKIDAPEKGQPFLNGEGDAGKVALLCLKGQLTANKVILIPEKRDVYQRLLGDIKGLSLRLVKEGCVSLYPQAIFSSREEMSTYLLAMQEAKVKRLGLWKYSGFLQPKLWRKKKISKRSVDRRKHR